MKKLFKKATMLFYSFIVAASFIFTTTSTVDATNKAYINKTYDLKWKTSFSGENYYEFYFEFLSKGTLSIEISKSTKGSSSSSLYPNTVSIYDKNGNSIYKEKIINGKNKFDEYKVLDFNIPSKGNYYIRINAGSSWRPVFSDGEAYWSQTVRFTYPSDNNTINDANMDWSSHWAKNTISDFMSKDYIGGYSDGSFKPDNDISRAEFVKIVNKVFGFTKKGTISFSDVNPSDWFYNDILIAKKAGYINGKSSTTFAPNDKITRQEVAAILTNIKNNKDTNYDKLNKFTDGYKTSSWAKSSVEGAIEAGYLSGNDKGLLNPTSNITRAESVSMLSRVK